MFPREAADGEELRHLDGLACGGVGLERQLLFMLGIAGAAHVQLEQARGHGAERGASVLLAGGPLPLGPVLGDAAEAGQDAGAAAAPPQRGARGR